MPLHNHTPPENLCPSRTQASLTQEIQVKQTNEYVPQERGNPDFQLENVLLGHLVWANQTTEGNRKKKKKNMFLLSHSTVLYLPLFCWALRLQLIACIVALLVEYH